jgi:GGDEF domain-containing protein
LYRRLSILTALVLAFLLGAALVLGPAPDWLLDRWLDLRVALRRYQIASGGAGIIYLMVSGYLLGQGLYLLVRQLLPGGLRLIRDRFAEYDASWDPNLGLLSRFGLINFLRRSIAIGDSNPATSHVSLVLLRIQGLARVNAERGVLRGQDLLRGLARITRDASVSRAVTGLRRWWRRLLISPRSMLNVTPSRHPRCPARWTGSTLAMGMNGQDTRDATIFARELSRRLDEYARDFDPDLDLRITGGLVLRPAGVPLEQTIEAAEAALRAADEEIFTVAYSPADGRTIVLQEFSDLGRLEHDFRLSEGQAADAEAPPRAAESPQRGWLRRWGLALGCFALIPVVLSVGNSDIRPPHTYPWPEDLETVDKLNARGVRKVPLTRTAAASISDGRWHLEGIRLDQLKGRDASVAKLRLTITNSDESPQHISMYDFTAVDSLGQRLPVMEVPSLLFRPSLGARTLEPRENWSGWLQFQRLGPPITAVLMEPSRRSRIYIQFKVD